MKSGNLNFLETSGPLQACNGTALLLPFTNIMEERVCPGYNVFVVFIYSERFGYKYMVRCSSVRLKFLSL